MDGGTRREVEGRAWGEGRGTVTRLGRNELINQLIKFLKIWKLGKDHGVGGEEKCRMFDGKQGLLGEKKIALTVLLPKHQRTLEQIRWHWSILGRVCRAEGWMARGHLPLCRGQLSLRAGSRVLKAELRHPVSADTGNNEVPAIVQQAAKTLGVDASEDVILSVCGLAHVYAPGLARTGGPHYR